MKQLMKFIGYLGHYKKWTFLGIILILLEVLMELVMPNMMSDIINIGIGSQDSSYIMTHVVLMVVLTILGVLGGIGSTYYAAKASGYVSEELKDELFQKISSLSFLELDQLRVGNLITVLTNDIMTIGSILMMFLRILIRIPILFLGSIVMAILISPKLSLLLLVLLPIMIIVMAMIMKKAFPYFDLTQKTTDEVNRVVRENVGGIRVVKATNQELYEKKKFDQVNQKLKQMNLKAIYLIVSALPFVMFLINIAIVFVLWYGGIEVMHGTFAIGSIMAFIQYLTNILSAVMMGSVMIVMLARSCTSASRIEEWMKKEAEPETGGVNRPITGKIEFRDVCFSYTNGSGDAVLKNINLVLPPNQTVGIVGPTGSGKTTFAELLTRHYPVSSGQILIDDLPITDYTFSCLRSQIAINFQKSTLFAGTVKENLQLSGEYEEEAMWAMCEVTCSAEFLRQKGQGLHYVLEQKGANLSGGQKQRLALTRTLLEHPKILILDDSTSAVDAKTEQQIIHNLKETIKGTIFYISNKISTVRHADIILVFDDGALVASGTHEELLLTSPFYASIVKSQERR